MLRITSLWLVISAVVAIGPGPARATGLAADSARPTSLGIGLSVLSELGFGGLIRGRLGAWGAELSTSIAPEYFINSGTPCSPVRFEFPFRVTASALVYFGREFGISHSMRAGTIYNVIYGWGGIIGYRTELNITRHLVFEAGTGFIIHPEGHTRVSNLLMSKCGSNANPSVTSELTNRIWLYFGMGLTLYLF